MSDLLQTCILIWVFSISNSMVYTEIQADREDCTGYYEVYGNFKEHHICANEHHFNSVSKKCDTTETANCRNVKYSSCPTKSFALLPHQFNNVLYYVCQNGKKDLKACRTGLQFNNEIRKCDWSKNAALANGITAHESDCSKFYQNVNGVKIVKTCPSKLFFNVNIGVCDYPKNVECIVNEGKCFEDDNTKPYEHDCAHYYVCNNKQEELLECPEGYYFNINSGYCDSSDENACKDSYSGKDNVIKKVELQNEQTSGKTSKNKIEHTKHNEGENNVTHKENKHEADNNNLANVKESSDLHNEHEDANKTTNKEITSTTVKVDNKAKDNTNQESPKTITTDNETKKLDILPVNGDKGTVDQESHQEIDKSAKISTTDATDKETSTKITAGKEDKKPDAVPDDSGKSTTTEIPKESKVKNDENSSAFKDSQSQDDSDSKSQKHETSEKHETPEKHDNFIVRAWKGIKRFFGC